MAALGMETSKKKYDWNLWNFKSLGKPWLWKPVVSRNGTNAAKVRTAVAGTRSVWRLDRQWNNLLLLMARCRAFGRLGKVAHWGPSQCAAPCDYWPSQDGRSSYRFASVQAFPWGWGSVLQPGRYRVRFPMESLELLTELILLAALWHWSRLSL
jgi:hypothetical protein